MADMDAVARGECSRAGVFLLVCAILQAGYLGLALLSGAYNALSTLLGLGLTVSSAQSTEEMLMMGGFYGVFGGVRFIQTLFDLLGLLPVGVTFFGATQLMRLGSYTWATRGMQAVAAAPILGLLSSAVSFLMCNPCGSVFGLILNGVLFALSLGAAFMASDVLGRDYVVAAFGDGFDAAI